MEIVRANEKHLAEIGKLWMEFMLFSRDIDPVFTPKDNTIPIFIKEHLRPAMETENSLVLIALNIGQVVGYLYSFISELSSLDKRDKYGVVHDLFITYAFRHRGIGEKMFKEIIRWFQENNIDRVELDVITENLIASSFWEKQGFTEIETCSEGIAKVNYLVFSNLLKELLGFYSIPGAGIMLEDQASSEENSVIHESPPFFLKYWLKIH